MSSYPVSYTTSTPVAYTPRPSTATGFSPRSSTATVADNNPNQHERYLASQMSTSSPAYTSSARVSRAMKGKRVHACEHPGCSKIFTRAEHRRRHELSHNPKKQHICMYEGCGKAFHRADYLSQHLSRHKPSNSKGKKTQSRGKQSLCQSTSHQSLPLQPAMSPSLPLAEPPSNSSRAWGSVDSGYSYSQCSRATSQSSMDEYPSPYSYLGEGCSSPMSTNTFTNPPYPSSGMSAEMMTAIDQYLRSVLKPEAFAVSPQPLQTDIWGSALEIDPMLTKIETRDQIPMDSWPPTSHPFEGHPTQMDQIGWNNPRPFQYRE